MNRQKRYVLILAVIFIVLVVGCGSYYFCNRDKGLLLYAHRGCTEHAPDCSRPAWEWAKKLGYYGIEVDIFSTSDNVFVVFHDYELDDLTDATGPVTDKSWEELSDVVYDAGSCIDDYPDLHISRIEELFSFVKENDMHVLLDVKTVHSYTELTEMIRDAGIEDLCVVCTCDPVYLDEVRAVSDKVGLRYWGSDEYHELVEIASGYEKCDFSYPREEITKEIVDYAHGKKVKVGVYSSDTVPEPEGEYKRLEELGVDSATVNSMRD